MWHVICIVYGVFTDHNLFKYILCLNDLDFITPKKTKVTRHKVLVAHPDLMMLLFAL